MKFITVLFRQDGTYAGTQGHELPLGDDYKPPIYIEPGETEPKRFIASHLGIAEMPGNGVCVSTELMPLLESHPDSTADAPKFGVRDWAAMPQIHDAPVFLSDFPAWCRKNGTERVPKFFRAWLTLMVPDLAKTYQLHRGVTLDEMIALEAKRAVRPEHSRLMPLKAVAKERAEERRRMKFARNRQLVSKRLSAQPQPDTKQRGDL